MRSLHINMILPFLTTKPSGGAKIMYEYANRLQARGHHVIVLHSIHRPYHKIKSPSWWKQFQYRLRGLSRPSWFPLHAAVQSLIVPRITDDYVPDGDITICTWWEMAYMINQLSPSKGQKFNLIQDYEIWKGHQELVHASYSLPVTHLVIARHLQHLVQQYSGHCPVHIPNAIDTDKFNIHILPEQRKAHSVCMLYSQEHRKGTSYGLKALVEVKKIFPDLQVQLFGVYDAPKLPEWIQYIKKPRDLSQVFNTNAIFLSPSLGEGWALPPAEAMACGCAVVCTRIGGHADYAMNGETALLAEPKNTADIVKKISELLQEQQLRVQIATRGHELVTTHFCWEASVNMLEKLFTATLHQ